MVVAAGGDGTIAEVAAGLIGTGVRLGIIPLGTANVLAHELHLPFAPSAVAAALAFGRTQLLWPGMAHGSCGDRLFVQMLGVGFDAHVVQNVSFPIKKILGKGAYVLQSARELLRYKFPSVRLRIDDVVTETASVIISKGRLYGGTYRLIPFAAPADPGFTVVMFDHSGPAAAAMYGAALPLNLICRAPGVRQIRAQKIDFLETSFLPAQTDGDTAGPAPLWVRDAPSPIQVVVG